MQRHQKSGTTTAEVGDERRGFGSFRPRIRRGGRRAGGANTRAEILTAARTCFAERGYAATTIRIIARVAGVDPALVIHYFGSKDSLFAMCLELPQDFAENIPSLLAEPKNTVGERFTRFYCEMWETSESSESLIAMLRSVAANEEAAKMAQYVISTQIVANMAKNVSYDQAELRCTLVGAQLFGLMFARHILQVEPLASAQLAEIVRYVAPSVQRYLADPLG